ncbi:Hypothetical predicted protein [Pelobates cultripes]|uniref:Uncharacterized protein n=1 Tax=Pelobates cultripes TaxID=61616 RepID=A0AAD1T5S1_PELCU|nr:Hypothetical predicted protein [Pelobates cultripes]
MGTWGYLTRPCLATKVTRQGPEPQRSLSRDGTAALPGLQPASGSPPPPLDRGGHPGLQEQPLGHKSGPRTTTLPCNTYRAVPHKMAAAHKPCARLAIMTEPIAEKTTQLEQGKSRDENISYHSRGESGAERVIKPSNRT